MMTSSTDTPASVGDPAVRRLTGRIVPYTFDPALVDELAVVVNVGFGLPARASRAASVRHLLLLTDPGGGRTYRQAAQRFLTMLDEALLKATLYDDGATLTEGYATGLRILFGLAPTYRRERSPAVRRHDAAVGYLVPGWREHRPTEPAATFERRFEDGALRQALHCLLAICGDAELASICDYQGLVGPDVKESSGVRPGPLRRETPNRWLPVPRDPSHDN